MKRSQKIAYSSARDQRVSLFWLKQALKDQEIILWNRKTGPFINLIKVNMLNSYDKMKKAANTSTVFAAFISECFNDVS